jgi:hypothetical protein
MDNASKTRRLLFRLGTVLILVAICAVMMVIGRGHTVYFDNKKLEYNGTAYECPYKIKVLVKDEQVANLKAKERGMATTIGQNFAMTLKITQEKGGDEVIETYQLKLPYNMDGIIVNIPGYLAGLPQEAWMSEFISTPSEAEMQEEAPTEEEDVLAGEIRSKGSFLRSVVVSARLEREKAGGGTK